MGIALRFQIAQKFHACSDPHDPPQAVNDRPRDLVDLILLRALLESDVTTTAGDLRAACVALFDARAAEAIELGRTARSWPPVKQMHRHWPADYERAARDARLADSLVEAIAQLNSWISYIETSPETKRTPR